MLPFLETEIKYSFETHSSDILIYFKEINWSNYNGNFKLIWILCVIF